MCGVCARQCVIMDISAAAALRVLHNRLSFASSCKAGLKSSVVFLGVLLQLCVCLCVSCADKRAGGMTIVTTTETKSTDYR